MRLMPDLKPLCSLISVAPADFVDVKFPSYEATMKILQAGFHLGWSAEHNTLDNSGRSVYIPNSIYNNQLWCAVN